MQSPDYVSPVTVDEVIALLGQDGPDYGRGMRLLAGVQPLAGGTDLLILMKADVAAPSQLVKLKRLNELPGGIEDTLQGVTLGALTTLAEIETHPLLKRRYPLLAQAAAVRLDGPNVADARLVLGGIAPIPWRTLAGERELLGSEVSAERIARAAEAALSGAEPLRYNAYKVSLAKALIRQALTTLARDGAGGI